MNNVYSLVYDLDTVDPSIVCEAAHELKHSLPEGSSVVVMPRPLQLEELTLREATRLKAFLEMVIFEKCKNKEAV